MPSQPSPSTALDALLARAREASSRNDAALADQAWRQVLAMAPAHPEAWYQLGWQAMSDGRLAQARDYLERAVAGAPEVAVLHTTLARVHKLAGQPELAVAHLERAIVLDPSAWGARFELGEVLASMGRNRAASMTWQVALSLVPVAHMQLPEVNAMVTRAQDFVARERGVLGEQLRASIQGSYAQASPFERRRIDACIAILEGRRSFATQQPATLPYPRLPAIPFFERDEFDWAPQVEAAFPQILDELQGVLAGHAEGFEPYVQSTPGLPAQQFAELDNKLDWGAYFLWKHGSRIDANCARCPKTEAALTAAPQVRIRHRAPVTFFSALKARTHIPPHYGATNTRLTVHLPLIVPDDCAIRVGGETRQWKPGELLLFDDTFEHEAWNRSDELRVVLIFDVWNPLLTPLERELVNGTIQGMLDFYRGESDLGEL
ncbi:aspartyl/asparaginyl beta-hydroxylase domain-containing protein [Lysobacter fragariae]